MNEKNTAATSSNPEPGVRLDRRALLRAGAGASPVLLTLVSNPVAATNSCVVASSFVSVATFKSRNPSVTSVNCATRRVEEWRTQCSVNPTLACTQPLVSACLGSTSSTYNGKKLRDVLCDASGISTSTELGVAQHLIALNLSITQGYMRASPGNVSPTYLGGIWTNYKSNGNRYRLPSSNVYWSSAQLIGWLRYQLNYSIPV